MKRRAIAVLSAVAVLAFAGWACGELISLPYEGIVRGVPAPGSATVAVVPKLVTGDYVLESPHPLQPGHPIRIEQLHLDVDGDKITAGRFTVSSDGSGDRTTTTGLCTSSTSSIVFLHMTLANSDYQAFWSFQSTGDIWAGTWIDNHGNQGTARLWKKEKAKE